MKQIIRIVCLLAIFNSQFSILNSQTCYWVMLTDKAGTTFDPYSYFDAKAIERYRINEADLYDISNYPLNESYVQQVNALATEGVGESRWFNAAAVMATPEQIAAISNLPFVREVVAIEGDMQQTSGSTAETFNLDDLSSKNLHDQLVRMGGKYFRDKGINGKGIRIAVFDGGFPQVNTHVAFKHLRDEGRIIKTWNFPNKKENVYGWNSHGLMTLSCIAARMGDMDLGMATGAEFLLARTEIEAEPFKEEVWWQMAVEWADKNGANIISSSLGYGKDRYYTKDMNGQSYVAKAGNMAARKGMLVCNSAGNEGDDKSWYTIITPSDADSVLCVGGIMPSLTDYQRTSFSSYGPSADGRQKPNVCAFAYAWAANTGSSNEEYLMVPGTSFSCPLVAGFAACAMQSRKGIKTMELFHEIEKSGDLYPYCDYTYGYGVPQADYFTGDRKEIKPTFKFEEVKGTGAVRIIPLVENRKGRMFIKNSLANGAIVDYRQFDVMDFNPGSYMEIAEGTVLTVNLNGYTESYHFAKPTNSNKEMDMTIYGDDGNHYMMFGGEDNTHFSTRLKESKGLWEYYLMLGLAVKTANNEQGIQIWSPAKHLGIRYTHYFAKAYGWGIAVDYDHTGFRFDKDDANHLDSLIAMDDNIRWLDKEVSKHRVNIGQLGLELYQRVRLVPGGIFHKGWHWDLGVYGTLGFNVYKLKGSHKNDIAGTRKEVVRQLDALDGYTWNWGVTTRISRDWLGIYARYRLNGIGKEVPADKVLLPRFEVGLQLAL
ncbi:MAG: S8 family serine peptidase [Bacteroidales bacterium]|nr:S8 family serine peptidase [Bacteroidales bacterium]